MNHASTLSERSLIDNCIKGNRKSQKELYERFAPKMFAICLQHARNKAEAEYMLQEGFVRLFSNLYRFENNQPFDRWVRRIFVKTATHPARQITTRLLTDEISNNIIKMENNNTLDSVYREVFIKTAKNSLENFQSDFKLYAVKGYLKKESVQTPTATKSAHLKDNDKEISPNGTKEGDNLNPKKKINFTYTIQREDYRRIDKKGILRVYNLSEPIDIPVVRILGRWKKEHIGVTLIATNGKWCIKGGAMQYSIPKHVENVSFPAQLFKKLVW